MAKQRIITLVYHREHEMACIREGSNNLITGNYWDFHPHCYGSVIHLDEGPYDFAKEWTSNGPEAVAKMIARHIGAKVVVKERKRPFPGC